MFSGVSEPDVWTIDPEHGVQIRTLYQKYQDGQPVDLSLYDVHVMAGLLMVPDFCLKIRKSSE